MKNFYLKQKVFSIKDRYKIYDENKNLMYQCKGRFFSLAKKLDLFDEQSGQQLYTLRKKIISIIPRYELFDAQNNKVATIRMRLTLFKTRIDIESDYGDLTITGDYYAHTFNIQLSGKDALDIHKKWLSWGDTYEISIYVDENEAFLLALAILIDHAIHNRKRKNKRNRRR